MVSCWIRHYNSEIHTIVKNHSNVFNLEYMNFILKQRIDEKKEGNKTVKQIMVFYVVSLDCQHLLIMSLIM